MTIPSPDGSRDRRIEDPTNLWLIHPTARALLPRALAMGLSANMVSVVGLLVGTAAAFSFAQWRDWRFAVLGLVLAFCWLVADGLDGMVARARGTSSAFGRMMDGLCDHGVFFLLYVCLAMSLGTLEAWMLAVAAGVAHAVQSSLYEAERARFHRRLKGAPWAPAPSTGAALVRLYDYVAGSMERIAGRFDARMDGSSAAAGLVAAYSARAIAPMRLLSLETANVRVMAIFVASVVGDPRIFWWFELTVLTVVAAIGITWHRQVEASLLRRRAGAFDDANLSNYSKDHSS
ncbi:hypothetical protein ASE75_06915 [Sphingomonas sp. Leaf17]|uniref:CDP-alcohol phosphatidyltransferase family protein n=1 Tax=Sphingomonas sp. Leaf17 TaxID=1735683 RepID=UPI0006F3AE09|nr:CDP-alcohol phosphatidyltransferase family protein [Sphingomonas sp. Leaf17]KQM64821.1 hypothetical protein ASE75_06915 [Sphingomonas sp. Leaf17]